MEAGQGAIVFFQVINILVAGVCKLTKQQLCGFLNESKIFFGTSLNEVMQGSKSLRILDVDITAGLTQVHS